MAVLCRQALRFQPSLHAARRELARAYVETGDRGNGLATLWQALRADPGEAGIGVVDFEEEDHAWVQVAWTHGRDRHLVGGPPSLAEPVRLHLLAQQLLRVQLESEA